MVFLTLLLILPGLTLTALHAARETSLAFALRSPLRDGAVVRRGQRLMAAFRTAPQQTLRMLWAGRLVGMLLAWSGLVVAVYLQLHTVDWLSFVALAAGTLVTILVLSDLLPRWWARRNPEATLDATDLAVRWLEPFLLVLTRVLGALAGKARHRRGDSNTNHTYPILPAGAAYQESLLDYAEEDFNDPDDLKQQVFTKALDFSSTRVRELMVPRTEIVAVPAQAGLEALRQKFIETEHSRIVVYGESLDNILGFVHSLALFGNPPDVASVVQPVLMVPDSMSAARVLAQFGENHKGLCIVVDEYGGTAGLVTLEDLVEAVFGEIEDEHDDDSDDGMVEQQVAAGIWRFSARLEVTYLNETYALGLPEGDYTTLGGLILHLALRIPEAGEVFLLPRLKLTVQQALRNKVVLVQLEHLTPTEAKA